MEWSKCPVCGEPFSEPRPGPLPGQTTYVHSNGVKHMHPMIASTLGAAKPTSAPTNSQPEPEKPVPFSDASGSSTKIPASLARQLRGGRR